MIRDTYSRTLEMLTTNIHRSINIYYVEIVFRKISNEKYYSYIFNKFERKYY